MSFLLVGLGNIGDEYERTRHNVGFMVLDELVRSDGAVNPFSRERLGEVARISHRGKPLILLKPSTFMNLSGRAVSFWAQRARVPVERILIIVDDLALPLGSVRLRAQGSDGGHNGLKSVQQHLGTSSYPRLRVGIGDDFPRGRQVDYVLQPFLDCEQDSLRLAIERAAAAARTFVTQPIARAMNLVNTPPKGPDSTAS